MEGRSARPEGHTVGACLDPFLQGCTHPSCEGWMLMAKELCPPRRGAPSPTDYPLLSPLQGAAHSPKLNDVGLKKASPFA